VATTATFEQIRAGLVANLSSLGIQSTGYMLNAPTAPSIEVFPGEVQYDQMMGRGLDEVIVTVRVTVTVSLDMAAQIKLDEYLAPSGAGSVKTLIETDRTLGGTVKTLQVTQASGYQVSVTKDGGQALSCDWSVRVLA
jgi:hypothetical protein